MRPAVKAAKELRCKTAAEIGVYRGENAVSMMIELNLDKLYLIDPYEVFDEPSSAMGKDSDFPRNEKIARQVLSGFAERCVWVKKRSTDVEIEPVDFVYIDGSHEYDNVCDDLEYYFEVAQKIIGGHDYFSKSGVKRAVDEFVSRNKLKLFTKKPDWWILK
jgi:hypothetical protein